jgi:predicted permease
MTRRSHERDLDREIRAHLDLETEEQAASGVPPDEAPYAAHRSFGNVTLFKEATREIWGWNSVERLWQDLRYAGRTFRKNPVFAATAIATLALGIGANTAIFSLLNAVMLKSLPVRDPAQLVLFGEGSWEGANGGPAEPGILWLDSYPLYQRLRAQNQLFEDIAAQQNNTSGVNVEWAGRPSDGTADFASGRCVSANYFDVLGVPAFRGRAFHPDDDAAGANPVVILSYGYWQRRFGANPALVNGTVMLNGAPYTVVGVTPPGFTGTKIGHATDLWVPLSMQPRFMRKESFLADGQLWWLSVIGRLKPGVPLAQAQANVNVTLQQFLSEKPPASPQEAVDRRAVRIELLPGARGFSGVRRLFAMPLMVLMAGVGVLLMIACVNVCHLLLARAIRRHREFSLRMALGASRARLLRQLLTEGLMLSALGGAAGVLIAWWLAQGLVRLADYRGAAVTVVLTLDARVIALTALVALAATVLFGLAPAWQSSGIQLATALKESARGITGGFRRRFSRLLLVFQVTLSVALLVGAGLLVRSLENLKNMNKGFDEEHVLLVEISSRSIGLAPEPTLALYDELISRVTALPGVRFAGLSRTSLLSGNTSTSDIVLPGYMPARGEDMEVQVDWVTPAYFDAVGIPLARGRRFLPADGADSPKVAIVNEAMARRFFKTADVVGRRFRNDPSSKDLEIVGVAKDAKVVGLREEVRPIVYVPVRQSPQLLSSLSVRATGDPGSLASQVRKTILDIRPRVPVGQVATLRARVEQSLGQERLIAELSSAFGLVALLLVSVGLYGALSQQVAQRSNEIGVRMALGASRGGVQWMVLREALMLVLAGIALGVPLAIAAGRLVTGLLFGLKPADPITLVAACATVLAVATLAAYVPARRASSVHPMTALRYE